MSADLALVRRLVDDGLSVGEAVRIAQDARASLDTISETVQLAAARILAQRAADIDRERAALADLADDYRHAGEQMRRAS